MKSGKIKILVADDHSVVRSGIIKALEANLPDTEFGEAGSASEISRLTNDIKWDLAILDISMPGRNGMDILKDLKENHPEIPVIIFSMYPEDQFALRAIKAGASAYLTKDISMKELSNAIRTILNGERYVTPKLVNLITNGFLHNNNNTSHEILSDREYQVFLMISSGKNISTIAGELSLSVKTISVYRSNILRKMSLKNNSEITHYAFKFNLVN